MKLKNQVAVTTGGASGLGAATANRFAAEGAKMAVADLRPAETFFSVLTDLADSWSDRPSAPTVEMDVSPPDTQWLSVQFSAGIRNNVCLARWFL